jgi:hypothetical protein
VYSGRTTRHLIPEGNILQASLCGNLKPSLFSTLLTFHSHRYTIPQALARRERFKMFYTVNVIHCDLQHVVYFCALLSPSGD